MKWLGGMIERDKGSYGEDISGAERRFLPHANAFTKMVRLNHAHGTIYRFPSGTRQSKTHFTRVPPSLTLSLSKESVEEVTLWAELPCAGV